MKNEAYHFCTCPHAKTPKNLALEKEICN